MSCQTVTQKGEGRFFQCCVVIVKHFHCCTVAQLAYVYCVLTKLNCEPGKNSWLYDHLSVEGAMYLLHWICIGCMFTKDIFSY